MNPVTSTSTTGSPGRAIPQLLVGRGEQLPIASSVVDLVTVENAPIRNGLADEIARVLTPGGRVRLLHPASYARSAGAHDAVAAALGRSLESRTTIELASDMVQTILRVVR